MNEEFKLSDFEPIIREVIESGAEFTMKTRGTSMLPMLSDGKDGVVLVHVTTPPKRGDVILFKRLNGQYVLHRIVGVRADGYVLRGDNQTVNEYAVKSGSIIAVMTAYIKDGKRIEVTDDEYRRYMKRLWFIHKKKLIHGYASAVWRRLSHKR